MNKSLGHYKMLGMVVDQSTTPHGKLKNKRRCNCRVCGDKLLRDTGFRWQYFYVDYEYNRGTHFFLCNICNTYWMTYFGYESDPDLINQYLIRFNIKRIISQTEFIMEKI